jgi:hypothetical protein
MDVPEGDADVLDPVAVPDRNSAPLLLIVSSTLAHSTKLTTDSGKAAPIEGADAPPTAPLVKRPSRRVDVSIKSESRVPSNPSATLKPVLWYDYHPTGRAEATSAFDGTLAQNHALNVWSYNHVWSHNHTC